MKKKYLSFLGFFILLSSTVFADFSDVSDDNIYKDAIDYVQEQGIVDGYVDGTYKPENTINRAEFTKIVIESQFADEVIELCIETETEKEWSYVFFPDVPKNEWFGKYICIAKAQGIIDGYPDETYRPEQNISFVEAAKIIVNIFEFETSDDEIWYKPFVEKLGDTNAIPLAIDNFEHLVSRGEMAEMIYRLKENIIDKTSHTYASLSQEKNIIFCGGINEIKCPEGFVCEYEDETTGSSGICREDTQLDPSCNLLPDAGPCKAAISKYYFDISRDSCTEFTWGGCEGIIPFETFETCEQICVESPEPEPLDPAKCDLIPDAGECDDTITKYYFDGESSCGSFTWSGCNGTVPFESQEECENTCLLPEESVVKEFNMVAKKWVFEPNQIIVQKGDQVRLTIISVDVSHGFALPDFDINVELKPGENVVVEFIADQAGDFTFFCSVFCGSGHSHMSGTLTVEEKL